MWMDRPTCSSSKDSVLSPVQLPDLAMASIWGTFSTNDAATMPRPRPCLHHQAQVLSKQAGTDAVLVGSLQTCCHTLLRSRVSTGVEGNPPARTSSSASCIRLTMSVFSAPFVILSIVWLDTASECSSNTLI